MEDISWPENLPSDRRRAIQELLRGREFAKQLKIFLSDTIHHWSGDDHHDVEGPVPVDDLVVKIMDSFTNSLSILNSFESDEVSQFPAATHVGSPDGGRKSEDSGESSKSTCTVKDRRGRYKRRKTGHSWIRETSDLLDDGYAWRKYGQKVILNARFPRQYYRCTHKYEQKCQATKQVQKIEEEPQLFRTTYIGNHTCKRLKASHHLILESPDDGAHNSCFMLSFNNSHNATNRQDRPYFTPSMKQEQEDVQPHEQKINMIHSNNDNNIKNQSSSSDYLMSPDSLSAFDQADVISGVNSSCCTTSAHSFEDIHMIVSSVDAHFDDAPLQYTY